MAYRDEEYEQLLARARAREMAERLSVVERCKERVLSHKAGVMYWLRNWTATENKQWLKDPNRLKAVAPFPYRPVPKFWTQKHLDHLREYFPHDFTPDDPPDYMDCAMGFLLVDEKVFFPKTREMMTSWLVTGYVTWSCQFFEKTEAISQSQKEDKASELIEYSNILYKHQPDWLRAIYPLDSEGNNTTHITWAHKGRHVGLPKGERQIASYHPMIYVMDEAAHLDEAEACYNVAKPACRQIIAISSAGPGWFANMCQPHVTFNTGSVK